MYAPMRPPPPPTGEFAPPRPPPPPEDDEDRFPDLQPDQPIMVCVPCFLSSLL